MHAKWILFSILLFCGLTTACTPTPSDNRPKITVSIEPLRYFVEQITGDIYQVTSLTPQGASPETYEPTPQQMVDLSQSQLYFAVGTLGYENTQLKKIAETAPSLKTVTLEKGIHLLPAAGHHGIGHTSDPHIWMSTRNASVIARHICEVMCRKDSVHAPLYQKNLAKFEKEIEALDARLRQQLQSVVDRSFLIYHPALGYYARDYGLKQLCIEHDGKEPGAQYLQQLERQCKAEHIHTVFVEKEYGGDMAKVVARDIQATVVRINPLGYDWPKEMEDIARNLVKYESR